MARPPSSGLLRSIDRVPKSRATVYGQSKARGTYIVADGAQTGRARKDGRPGSGAVRLWDGKDYPVESVDAICPGLAVYAREHPVLLEEMPDMHWRFACEHARIAILVSALFWAVPFAGVILLGAERGRLYGALSVVLLAVLISTPITLAVTLAALATFSSHRTTVYVEDGKVFVKRGNSVWRKRLTDCSWFKGRVYNMCLGRRGGNPMRDPAILIELEEFRQAVGVGFTPETRRIWESFLTLADVRRNVLRERRSRLDTD